ncbi:hypothetical protein [Pseudonocardia sp. ICBG601]|uniref:hypothetical protein n=1 Tax=Pseudonocardia sp. ICBG601 TaxID=2846759 RepID=UPI001CF6C13C|nr:hypothetical protein [Pseudonocardia sp. ICBG601]
MTDQLAYRLFRVGYDDGSLYSPFPHRFDAVPAGPVTAACVPYLTPDLEPEVWWERFYDPDAHDVPGQRCGCGWRVYPTLADACDGARQFPRDTAALFTGERPTPTGLDLALVTVRCSGGAAPRHAFNVPGLSERGVWPGDDEVGTIRVATIQVAGPAWLPPHLPRRVKRSLVQRYSMAAPELIVLDRPVFTALLDNTIADTGATAVPG